MESQPQNPEFRINPEYFHPWICIMAVHKEDESCFCSFISFMLSSLMSKPTQWHDSDQPWQAPSLLRVFTVHLKIQWVLSYHQSFQRRLDGQTGQMTMLTSVFTLRMWNSVSFDMRALCIKEIDEQTKLLSFLFFFSVISNIRYFVRPKSEGCENARLRMLVCAKYG